MSAAIAKNVEPSPSNLRGRPWNSKEIAQLRRIAALGAPAIAELLDRSVQSVKYAANRHRISLRQPGSRVGTILGQPRGVRFTDLRSAAAEARALEALREGVLDGTIDPTRVEELARRQARLAAGAELCPSCVRNPVEIESTGYCRDCHLRRLAEAHRDAQSQQEAQRELWRERQRKKRGGRARSATRKDQP